MASLRELQAHFTGALVHGDAAALAPLLVGGERGLARLAVHQRHYQASLVRALLQRFPATVWLTGSGFIEGAARRFVQEHPPERPCLAEYGDEFPGFLAALPEASGLPYLLDFAELERRFGQAALQIDLPPLPIDAIAALDPTTLPGAVVTPQPGLSYWRAAWPVDDLLRAYLADSAPDRFELRPETVYIRVRGARGDVRLTRLPPGEFTFGTLLASGHTLGAAAERAMESDSAFDPGRALGVLITDGLITAIMPPDVEKPS